MTLHDELINGFTCQRIVSNSIPRESLQHGSWATCRFGFPSPAPISMNLRFHYCKVMCTCREQFCRMGLIAGLTDYNSKCHSIKITFQ